MMPTTSAERPRGSDAKSPTFVRPSMVLAATILASSLSFIDSSVVNVGLAAIGRALGSDAAGLQWVINAYLLPLSALLLLGGALGDRFGRRRLLMVGTLLFALASLACGLAPDAPVLTVSRAMQGFGAALLMPNSLAILSDNFEGAARGRAVGTWAAVGAVTSGLGPLLGGWLIDAVGWRAIFLVNLPVAGAALLLAWQYVPAGLSRKGSALDLIGGLLATAALAALTYGLIDGAGPLGWTTSAVMMFAAGIAGLATFLAWEWRMGRRAMMPLALFRTRSFISLNLLTLLLYGALGALSVLVPFTVMQVGGARAIAAGASLVPIILAIAAFSPPFGALAGRIGARPLLFAGASLVAGGFLMILRVDVNSSYATGLLPALCFIGVGLAAAVAPLTTAVLMSVEAAMTGVASGFNSAIARTGGLLATACLGRLLAADGAALVSACHVAASIAAIACLAAAACALLVDVDAAPG